MRASPSAFGALASAGDAARELAKAGAPTATITASRANFRLDTFLISALLVRESRDADVSSACVRDVAVRRPQERLPRLARRAVLRRRAALSRASSEIRTPDP